MPVRTSTRTSAIAVASAVALGLVPATVLAPEAGAATPTKLTVRTNKTVYVAGAKISIAAHLNVANAPVKFYEKLPGHKAKTIFGGRTDAKGNEAIKGTARYNATYIVRFAGGKGYEASRGEKSVKVHVRMPTQLRNGFRTSGAYRVFHATKKGVFVVGVAPSKKGTRVSYRLQVLSNGAWKTLDTRKYTLNKDSVAAGTFRGVAGHKYRLRASWAGDKLNLGNHTAYRYARFVS